MFRTWILLGILVLFTSTSRAFLSIPFNTSKYFGPDGPWQAVSLGLKYPSATDYSTVSVYPANLYNTVAALYVPTPQACTNDTSGDCASGGTVSPLTFTNGSSWYTYFDAETGYFFYYNGSTAYMDALLPQGIVYNRALVDVCNIAHINYPGGKTVAVEAGLGGLGGSPLKRQVNLPLTLYSDGITQSNSYGLHIGAAQFGYCGSLIFGGYDRGRAIGPALSYDAYSSLSLIDIIIGVETGGSPFSFDSKQHLLKSPGSAVVSQPVATYLKPEYPYLFLPQATIDAITVDLPVKFDSNSGFYLWDTQNPSYKNIVGSPAYLGFVFPSMTGNTANTTIKVPFALLNLTLETSISGLDSDVPYFPVMNSESSETTDYAALLGRAFLQSAFMGTNWNKNVSWLAQAPGPGLGLEGLGYDAVDIENTAQTLNVQAGENLFNKSWTGHWSVLESSSGNGGGGGGGGGSGVSGLSGGAIGGIAVGGVAFFAIVGAIIAFILIRRKKRASSTDHPTSQYEKPYDHEPNMSGPVPHEMDSYYKPQRYSHPHEMDGGGYGELPGVRYDPQELPASNR